MKRKALILGVDQYKGNIFCPQFPLKDAEAIAQLLRKSGQFEVQLLLNGVDQADQKNYEHQDIEDLISQLLNPPNPQEEDIVLFYFSGNGGGIYGAEDAQQGDLLLTNFPELLIENLSKSTPESRSRCISLQWLHDQLEKSSVNQQIVWFDSDFSSRFIELFSESSAEPKYNRCFIVAKPSYGGVVEEGSTHGVFTDALLQCLNPEKQLKHRIYTNTLAEILVKTFNWPETLIKNTGKPIWLTERNVRAQKLWNDLAEGEDLLNLKSETDALADVLLLKDLVPPLAVGILGGWGSGKSFIMNLIQQRMNEIRSSSLNQEQAWGKDNTFPYVGHIYQVKFDAWTYAKADLWYSLTQKIFDEFNRQYILEKRLETILKKSNSSQLEGGKFWQVLNAMNSCDRDIYLGELEALPPKDLAILAKRLELLENRKSKQEFMDCLLKNAEESHRDTMLEIEKIKKKLETENKILSQRIFWRMPIHFLRKNWLSSVAFLVGISIIAFPFVTDRVRTQFLTLTGGGITVLGTGLNFWKRTREEQEKILGDLKQAQGEAQKKIEQGEEAWSTLQREVLQSDSEITKQVKKIKQYEAKIEQLQRTDTLDITASSLDEIIQELARDELYEKKLGYLHQLQRRFTDLTNCLYCNSDVVDFTEKLQETFPRGPARIVLFIDDLDRCPPDRVVEVLEAVQLLVKTPLFIAILAIDERYITRALEKRYQDILVRRGSPSGTDYLEKIIQIPYRVRPIARSALSNYLDKQMEVEHNLEADQNTIQKVSGSDFQGQKIDTSGESNGSQPLAPTHSEPELNLTLDTLKFTKTEFDELLKCCQQVDLSPRMIKRLVNIYKIFKIREFYAGKKEGKPVQQARAILSILALSARYPDLIREMFENLDLELDELDVLEQEFKKELQELEEKRQTTQAEEIKNKGQELKSKREKLNAMAILKFFQDLVPNADDAYLRREYKRLNIDAKALLQDITLADFDRETFDLLRSFRFFGDIGYSPEDSQRTVHFDAVRNIIGGLQ